MPPKKKGTDPGKKTVEKAKAKIVEDKTFGLKNKKGTKQQKYITTVEKTVLHGSKTSKQIAKDQEDKQAKKDEKKKLADELNTLFRPVEQKVAKGTDPKSVLCAFYKVGQCKKGEKCKFSHDLNVGRKGEKRNMYEAEGETEGDHMEDWDEAKLEEVVNKKHGEANKSMPATAIICKYFLDAVENNKYGWFWSCPGGDKCHYKHALPPGFVLKKDLKKDDKDDKISLEELIEKERAALGSNNLTKVTLESFLKWKERKRKEKVAKAKKDKDHRKAAFTSGKSNAVSGREMFEFNPDMIVNDQDDPEAGDDFDLSQFRKEETETEEEEEVVHEVCDNMYVETAPQAGDKVTTERLQPKPDNTAKHNGITNAEPMVNGIDSDESNKLDVAGALPREVGKASEQEVNDAIAAATAAVANGDIDIDENLFDGDDLLDIEQELETLDLNE